MGLECGWDEGKQKCVKNLVVKLFGKLSLEISGSGVENNVYRQIQKKKQVAPNMNETK